jgi:death-on-curing protein
LPSGRAHYRLTLADALAAHEVALTYGGRPGILNQPSLESALQRPYSGYYRAIEKKAAALVQSVTGNHAFVDGNKRTCLLLLGLLLDRSGYRLAKDGSPETNEAVEEMIASVAEGAMSFDEIYEWMAARIGKRRSL